MDDTARALARQDRNTSYDVWCTAEFNDFRDDQAGQDLLTPFPKSTILSIESSYYTAQVLVQVTKGPASIFCQAYPWALRPFTERPRIPTNLELQTSPFKTNYLNAPNGKVLIEIQARVLVMAGFPRKSEGLQAMFWKGWEPNADLGV